MPLMKNPMVAPDVLPVRDLAIRRLLCDFIMYRNHITLQKRKQIIIKKKAIKKPMVFILDGGLHRLRVKVRRWTRGPCTERLFPQRLVWHAL